MKLLGASEQVAAFVAARLGYARGFGPCQAIGFLDRGGVLVAGLVYHNWSPEAGVIEISAASTGPGWATRGAIRDALAYPFDQIGCQMVIARTADGNDLVRRIFAKIGAQTFTIPRMRGRDEAEVVATLTVEQWRASRFMRA